MVISGGRQEGNCNYHACWKLYEDATIVLGVQDDYDTTYKPTDQDLQARCVALRTFHRCIGNLTSHNGCIGNLNFHSAQKGIEQQIKQNHCNATGPLYDPSEHPYPHGSEDDEAGLPCTYLRSGFHRHCGLFGDPHLRTWSGDYETCRVQGAWPLIDNNYLTVQVTNELVSRNSMATAPKRVSLGNKKIIITTLFTQKTLTGPFVCGDPLYVEIAQHM